MHPFLRALRAAAFLASTVFVSACASAPAASPSSSASSSGSGAPDLASPPSDQCAGDPWLGQVLGRRPELTNSMRVDVLAETRLYGAAFAGKDRPEMDSLGEFASVPSRSAEVYEWEGPARASSSSGHETARVIVARHVFGDPRSFKSDGKDLYLAPLTLANGTLEYPPAPANVDAPFAPNGGQTIFTFPDGTWVRVDGWMVQPFRAAFASAGAPPLPPSAPDVAWEVCAEPSRLDGARSGVWGVIPQRGVLRFLSGSGPDVEMVFRFATQDLAERAKNEQAARCAQRPYVKSNDNGMFDLIPPCAGQVSAEVDGPMLRYVYRF